MSTTRKLEIYIPLTSFTNRKLTFDANGKTLLPRKDKSKLILKLLIRMKISFITDEYALLVL